ncbi:hypothetical protein Pcinc_038190 [Petrolisthes cinctipes]|uniref:Uncharacterized protein n=1 Tax=Petrolisthes cinctipes TaxID=88211 RepID=A0AAE1BSH2_PETCI|nr:hypothetical protein Pcinc_038190 [Petrolisthes cinctipes]
MGMDLGDDEFLEGGLEGELGYQGRGSEGRAKMGSVKCLGIIELQEYRNHQKLLWGSEALGALGIVFDITTSKEVL